ncbi:MAG: hypothetical protein KDD25_02975 [Bdellovibrionales bacterium]|nr:hypothetical protein [Bdellovibrionales bacterium]
MAAPNGFTDIRFDEVCGNALKRSDPHEREWTWEAPKRLKSFVGSYRIQFPNSADVPDLPTEILELTTRPWREIYNEPISPYEDPRPLLEQRPIFRVKILDIDEFVTYHQTSFAAAGEIVRITDVEPLASGTLESKKIRMTNSEIQPAFYTQLDVASSLLQGLPQDVILKIRLKPRKQVLALILIEPSDTEAADLLSRLTGNPNYWQEYKQANLKGDVYDFDLFQNAVVGVLRERYGYNFDLMLYLNSFEASPMNVGGKQTWTYAWPVIYNKDLLVEARVENIYYYPYSTVHSSEADGTNDWLYVPVSMDFIDTMKEYPLLDQALRRWSTSTPYSSLISKMAIDSQTFWSEKYMDRAKRYLVAEGYRKLREHIRLESNADSKRIDEWIIEILASILSP